MKLDAKTFRYMTRDEWRVLEAIEIGSKNHEYIPVPLIAQLAHCRAQQISQPIKLLLKNKLIVHTGQHYDGYKLTYLGLDYLALRVFVARNLISAVGTRVGVGKESDIHMASTSNGDVCIVKLHRLGRISFRAIKSKRDYMGKRQSASWMYMARLAAEKEFKFMLMLRELGLPVPEPKGVNRHAVVMSHIDATPMQQVKSLENPVKVLEDLMELIVRLAEHGFIHGDFNEFNLMIDDEENITLIDFPQMVSVFHENAQFYFDRDVDCVRRLFETKFKTVVTEWPHFEQIALPTELDDRVRELLKVPIKMDLTKETTEEETGEDTEEENQTE